MHVTQCFQEVVHAVRVTAILIRRMTLTTCMLFNIFQEVVSVVNLTVLKQHQYCVVLDPMGSDGRSRLGVKELRVGPRTFFLQPGKAVTVLTVSH